MANPRPGQVDLTEEVPEVEPRWYIWHWGEKGNPIWRGDTRKDGEAWAAKRGLKIDCVEAFEP